MFEINFKWLHRLERSVSVITFRVNSCGWYKCKMFHKRTHKIYVFSRRKYIENNVIKINNRNFFLFFIKICFSNYTHTNWVVFFKRQHILKHSLCKSPNFCLAYSTVTRNIRIYSRLFWQHSTQKFDFCIEIGLVCVEVWKNYSACLCERKHWHVVCFAQCILDFICMCALILLIEMWGLYLLNKFCLHHFNLAVSCSRIRSVFRFSLMCWWNKRKKRRKENKKEKKNLKSNVVTNSKWKNWKEKPWELQ